MIKLRVCVVRHAATLVAGKTGGFPMFFPKSLEAYFEDDPSNNLLAPERSFVPHDVQVRALFFQLCRLRGVSPQAIKIERR